MKTGISEDKSDKRLYPTVDLLWFHNDMEIEV
jgi:hypothetical protein